MGTVSKGITWANGSGGGTPLSAANLNLIASNLLAEFNGSISNANIAADAAIVATKLDLSSIGAIGGGTPAAGTFTTLTATTIDGIIGSVTPAAITATSLTLASGATVTAILDEDDMATDSATALATQQSIKAYVDGLTGTALDISDDTTPQLGGDLDLNGNNIDFPTTANISDCIDDDTMATASATTLATSESIKAYVDSLAGGGIGYGSANAIVDWYDFPNATASANEKAHGQAWTPSRVEVIAKEGSTGSTFYQVGHMDETTAEMATVSWDATNVQIRIRNVPLQIALESGNITFSDPYLKIFLWK